MFSFTIVNIERRSQFVHELIFYHIVVFVSLSGQKRGKLVVIKSLDQAHRNTLLEDSENPLRSRPRLLSQRNTMLEKEMHIWKIKEISFETKGNIIGNSILLNTTIL